MDYISNICFMLLCSNSNTLYDKIYSFYNPFCLICNFRLHTKRSLKIVLKYIFRFIFQNTCSNMFPNKFLKLIYQESILLFSCKNNKNKPIPIITRKGNHSNNKGKVLKNLVSSVIESNSRSQLIFKRKFRKMCLVWSLVVVRMAIELMYRNTP